MKKQLLVLAGLSTLLLSGCFPKTASVSIDPDSQETLSFDLPSQPVSESSEQTPDSQGSGGEETSQGSGDTTSQAPSGEKKKIKIQFHVDSKSAEGVAYKKRVDAFNTQYKDKYVVTAIFKARTQGGADYEQQLIAQKMDGTLPDIITFDAPNCASYAKAELLYPLTNIYPDSQILELFKVPTS